MQLLSLIIIYILHFSGWFTILGWITTTNLLCGLWQFSPSSNTLLKICSQESRDLRSRGERGRELRWDGETAEQQTQKDPIHYFVKHIYPTGAHNLKPVCPSTKGSAKVQTLATSLGILPPYLSQSTARGTCRTRPILESVLRCYSTCYQWTVGPGVYSDINFLKTFFFF